MLSWFMAVLPDSFLLFVFYSFFFAGMALIVASWWITFIPLISRYRFPTQVIGILVFAGGSYLLGGFGIEQVWRERIKELEAKVQAAEEKSHQVNTVVKEKIVYKNKVIKQQEIVYLDRIKEVAVQIDAKCDVDASAIDILNRAATDPAKVAK
jgi:uncharacterized membrane protein